MTDRQKERRPKDRARGSDAQGPAAGASPSLAASPGKERDDEDLERRLGRVVAVGIPAASILGAVAAGTVAGAGSALLVLAAGALVGAIGLLWASVRTLSGDAPLASDFESLAARRHGVDALAEQKDQHLRALRDLKAEHELGKIDDADYELLEARYRDETKSIMRQMDLEVAPLRDQAERIAREYLKKRGLGQDPGEAAVDDERDDGAPEESARRAEEITASSAKVDGRAERASCPACGASNEGDASFCKQCGTPMKRASDAIA